MAAQGSHFVYSDVQFAESSWWSVDLSKTTMGIQAKQKSGSVSVCDFCKGFEDWLDLMCALHEEFLQMIQDLFPSTSLDVSLYACNYLIF